MAGEPVDLVRFEGDGASVVLRVAAGPDDEMLAGEVLVASAFVSGRVDWELGPEDLRTWQQALDELDAGYDIVWRDALVVERVDDGLIVTVRDGGATAVSVTVPLADAWFDDVYERLDLVWKTWPRLVRA